MTASIAILISILLILGNAYFVGAEFALISARRSAIETKATGGSKRATTTLNAMEHVSLMLAGSQLGVTICSLGLGALAEPAIASIIEPILHALHLPESLLHPVSFVIALAIVVFLHVVFGEMVPKNISLAGPESAALVLVPPLTVFVKIFKPFIVALNWLANLFLRMVGVKPKDEVASAFTREEVTALVDQSLREGALETQRHDLAVMALALEEARVDRVVLPLDRLRTIPITSTPEEVEATSGSTGFSRLPVTAENGEVVGYLHLKDVLIVPVAARKDPIDPSLVRPFTALSVDDTLPRALEYMQSAGAHLGAVHDASGALVGLVTLEDVLQELVGEIRDGSHAMTTARANRVQPN